MVWVLVANGDWTRINLGPCGEGDAVALYLDEATFERLKAGELDADDEELRVVAMKVVPVADAVAIACFTRDLIERTKAIR